MTTFYDPATPRDWKYSEMRASVEADRNVKQKAFLDQPMRAPTPSALIHADGIIEEAFHELPPGVNCAIYQLSKHRDVEYDKVEAEGNRFPWYPLLMVTPPPRTTFCSSGQVHRLTNTKI